MKMKPITTDQRLAIDYAILHLAKARGALRSAGATKTAAYVSRAMKSAEGAARHADRRLRAAAEKGGK